MSNFTRIATVAAAVLLSVPALAQDTTPKAMNDANVDRPTGPGAPNVTPSRRDEPGSSSATTSTPPIAGANSFTETQARERIAKSGFSEVQNLRKDDQGIWRGQAQKNGAPVNVALDYRGNVVQQ